VKANVRRRWEKRVPVSEDQQVTRKGKGGKKNIGICKGEKKSQTARTNKNIGNHTKTRHQIQKPRRAQGASPEETFRGRGKSAYTFVQIQRTTPDQLARRQKKKLAYQNIRGRFEEWGGQEPGTGEKRRNIPFGGQKTRGPGRSEGGEGRGSCLATELARREA